MNKLTLPNEDTIVLLSGGVESSALLQEVKKAVTGRVSAIHFNAGQLSAPREHVYAARLCHRLNIQLYTVDISAVFQTLQAGVAPLPYHNLDEHTCTSYPYTILAAVSAWRLSYKRIYRGLTKSDAEQAQHMNYKTMLDAMRTLLDVLTQGQIQYADPFLESDMSDEDVLREAVEKRFNYSETWSCQWGFFYHCGECRTCKKRSSLFTARLGKDATKYMDDLGTKVILPDSI